MTERQPSMLNEDSISSQDPHLGPDGTKTKSRRPANTAFRQQRLKAWQPILTPKSVLPLFFAIGIIFAPIGGGLLYASSQVQEIILDYSKCYTDAPYYPDTDNIPSDLVSTRFLSTSKSIPFVAPTWSRINTTEIYSTDVSVDTVNCQLNFTIQNPMNPPVLFYYRLTNFYQNHRRYAKSFNTDQLSGTAVSASTIDSSDCTPLTTTTNATGVKIPYYPCGLAANSVFNDTFFNPVLLNVPATDGSAAQNNETYVMENNTGISWDSDRTLYGESKYNWSEVAVPPNWVKRYPNNYSDAYHPDLVNDSPFQVWMRLAGLPTFSKLAQRNDTTTMGTGRYSVNINHHFDVTEYGGTKSIIISTRTVMGGRNPFLGIAYVIVGGICIILGAIFTVTHLIKPRKLGDHTYLSWNNEGPSASSTAREG